MIIDCGSCAVAGLACGDCVVSVLLGIPEVIGRHGGLGDGGLGDGEPAHGGLGHGDLGHGDLGHGDFGEIMGEISAMPLMHVEDEHAAALEVLAGSGLVPPLRLVPRSQAS